MNEDKTLEERITGALSGTDKPFDFEAFKQRYPDQVKLYRAQVQRKSNKPVRLKQQLGLFVKLAVAALVLVGIGLSLMNVDQREDEPELATRQPAPSMMSVLALNRAYREGGLEAIDNQYEQAFTRLGPRTSSVAWSNVINESL